MLGDDLHETEIFKHKLADSFPKDLLSDIFRMCLKNSKSSFRNFATAVALSANKSGGFSWTSYSKILVKQPEEEDVECSDPGICYVDRVNAFHDAMFGYGRKEKLAIEKLSCTPG